MRDDAFAAGERGRASRPARVTARREAGRAGSQPQAATAFTSSGVTRKAGMGGEGMVGRFWLLVVSAGLGLGAETIRAEPAAENGQVITLRSPVTGAVARRAQAAADEAVHRGARRLIFLIQPGKSEFHDCARLADFIAGVEGAQTVAYIPKPLEGHAVMLALACDEIVLHPEATIGNAGGGKMPGPVELAQYTKLARANGYPLAIALKLLDKSAEVWEVHTAAGRKDFVTKADLEQLQKRGQVVGEPKLIKEAGLEGVFTAQEARDQLGLAKLLASSIAEVVQAYGLDTKAAQEDPLLGQMPRPVMIKIVGMIDPFTLEYVGRRLADAQNAGKNLIIVHIDSEGGWAKASIDVAYKFKDLPPEIKTVAYVPRQAYSGAAFVALGCDEIVMGTDAILGDAGPIFRGRDAEWRAAPAKALSFLIPSVRQLAEANGYSPALAEAMVNEELVVYEVVDQRTGAHSYLSQEDLDAQKARGEGEHARVLRTVKGKGLFLTCRSEQAKALGFARELVGSFDELKSLYGLEDTAVPEYGPTWVDTLVAILNAPAVTGFLLIVGLVCLYLEVKLAGFGLPGIVAGLCFLIFFWSKFLYGTATGLEILLFLAGLVCLALEIFVLPGFGVTGVTGILLIVFSLVMAQTTVVIPHSALEMRELTKAVLVLTLSLAALTASAIAIGRYFPSMPLFQRIVLSPDAVRADTELAGAGEASGHFRLVGQRGVATTPLRPAGKAQFGDTYLDVVAEGSYVEQGSPIEILEVQGNRVVVKQV